MSCPKFNLDCSHFKDISCGFADLTSVSGLKNAHIFDSSFGS